MQIVYKKLQKQFYIFYSTLFFFKFKTEHLSNETPLKKIKKIVVILTNL